MESPSSPLAEKRSKTGCVIVLIVAGILFIFSFIAGMIKFIEKNHFFSNQNQQQANDKKEIIKKALERVPSNDVIFNLPYEDQVDLILKRREHIPGVIEEQIESSLCKSDDCQNQIADKIKVTNNDFEILVDGWKYNPADISKRLCQPGGWSGRYGQIEFCNNLKHAYRNGFDLVKITGTGKTVIVEFGGTGKCLKTILTPK